MSTKEVGVDQELTKLTFRENLQEDLKKSSQSQ